MTACLMCLLVSLPGSYPDYIPPPQGVGAEILPLNARSFAMGGVSVSVRESSRFSLLNPAASGWTRSSGVCFGGRYADGDVDAWDGDLGFPEVSALVPLPFGVVLSGAIVGRSRIAEESEILLEDYDGSYDWTGGLTESYAGFSVRAADWLSVSLGGRCTFGSIVSDVILKPLDPGPPVPVNTVYRDDASFRQAWGGVFGLMVDAGALGLGFSISTDREGDIEVLRDYSGHGEDTLTARYGVPGELTAGISFRPLSGLVVGGEVYSRKALNFLGSRTDEGSILSTGVEYEVLEGLTARAGYSRMSGLWRDGANSFRAGMGYVFGGDRAGLDLAAGYQYWRDDQDDLLDETVFMISLWASERWLGN